MQSVRRRAPRDGARDGAVTAWSRAEPETNPARNPAQAFASEAFEQLTGLQWARSEEGHVFTHLHTGYRFQLATLDGSDDEAPGAEAAGAAAGAAWPGEWLHFSVLHKPQACRRCRPRRRRAV